MTTNIFLIEEKDLPYWKIQTNTIAHGWDDFTEMPFKTQKEADDHVLVIVEEYNGGRVDPEKIRVIEYTAADWRRAVIKYLMREDYKYVIEAIINQFTTPALVRMAMGRPLESLYLSEDE